MSTHSPTGTSAPTPAQPQACAPGEAGMQDVLALNAASGPDIVTLELSWAQAQALTFSIEAAERGRDEVAYLIGLGRGELDPDNIVRMRSWHEREIAVEQDVLEQIRTQQEVFGTAGTGTADGRLIGMIEWPAEAGLTPDLLVGAGSAPQLDRMFVARLRQMIEQPPAGVLLAHELMQFVRENGWPPQNAVDGQVLTWLSGLHEAANGPWCSIWQPPPGRGLAVQVHPGRYSSGRAQT